MGTQLPTTGTKVPMGVSVSELISISEAASRLGTKPWEVERLLAAGRLQEVVLVDADSLREYQEQQ